MFTSFYYNEMQKETEELTSHFIGMAESQDSSNEQMMSTFAEFSDVSIFNISKDGNVILHSGVHDRSDRSFIKLRMLAGFSLGKVLILSIKILLDILILSLENQ